MPEHLNHYGYLFGGNMLKWVDEYAWIAATLDYPNRNLVTIGMDRVEFKQSIKEGAILKFEISNKPHVGNTSLSYNVNVYNAKGEDVRKIVFSTIVTFVNVDENGKKKAIMR